MRAIEQKEIFEDIESVVAFVATIDAACSPGNPRELEFVSSAVKSRQREFAAGRNIARACLARVGSGEAIIPVSKSRAPVWPSGFAGSISHTGGIVGAAVCSTTNFKSVGLDMEKCDAVSADLFNSILTRKDIDEFGGTPNSSMATLVFSCKEAVYKAVHPLTGEYLDFSDVSIRIAEDRFRAECRVQKDSSEIVYAGRGFLETNADFVRALFLIE